MEKKKLTEEDINLIVRLVYDTSYKTEFLVAFIKSHEEAISEIYFDCIPRIPKRLLNLKGTLVDEVRGNNFKPTKNEISFINEIYDRINDYIKVQRRYVQELTKDQYNEWIKVGLKKDFYERLSVENNFHKYREKEQFIEKHETKENDLLRKICDTHGKWMIMPLDDVIIEDERRRSLLLNKENSPDVTLKNKQKNTLIQEALFISILAKYPGVNGQGALSHIGKIYGWKFEYEGLKYKAKHLANKVENVDSVRIYKGNTLICSLKPSSFIQHFKTFKAEVTN